jgi:hypothetical protein
LLFVPISLLRRRLSPLWFAPLLLWIGGNGWSFGEPVRIVPFLILCAIPFVLALQHPSPAPRARTRWARVRPLKLSA